MDKCWTGVEINFPLGRVKGEIRHTIYELPYYSFEGIPYAHPPVGKLRFKAPVPISPWSDVLDCTASRSKPTQKNLFTGEVTGSEDCLYLNVYVKLLKTDKPLPVMVYIYGGAFVMGEASRENLSPDYLMKEQIVLVTLNYRLCSLGFLSFKDDRLAIPGNAGLKDQILALKWIHEHIAHFNGDPKNVTVFGESAGGASTHFLCLTPQTEGLFHRAILMSGCALNEWAYSYPEDLAFRLAKFNGYTGENVDADVLKFLSTLHPYKLVDHKLLTEQEINDGELFTFKPIMEPYWTASGVLLKTPLELLQTTWSNKIPIMIGGTSHEGLFNSIYLREYPQFFKLFQSEFQRLLPREIKEQVSEEEAQVLSERIRNLHFDDKEVSEKTMHRLLDLYSYKTFWHGLHRVVLARLKYASDAPTYLYRFEFDSPNFNYFRNLFCGKGAAVGAAHADDLCYLFFFDKAWKVAFNSLEYKMIWRMVSIYTSFARDSNPNCNATQPAVWLPLDKENPYEALKIGQDIEVSDLEEKTKMEVWHSLYKEGQLY